MEAFSRGLRAQMMWDEFEKRESEEMIKEKRKNVTSYPHLPTAKRRGNCNDDY